MNLLSQPVFYILQAHGEAVPSMWESIINSNIINFLIAFLALVWVFKRFKLLSILDQRQAKIVQALQEAEEKRQQALKDLDAIEKRMAQLNQEVDAILSDAQHSAEDIANSIVQQAQEDAEKLLANAQKRIAMEQKTASRELEQRLMHEAIHAARELLENTLSEADKHRSVEDFVASLPKLYSQGV